MLKHFSAFVPLLATGACEHSSDDVDSEVVANDTAASCSADSDLETSGREVDFGEVRVGDGETLRLALSAVGTCDTHVSAATMTNPDFWISTAPGFVPPFELEAGSGVYWELVYVPSAVEADTGTLLIDSDDPTEPRIEIELNGQGT